MAELGVPDMASKWEEYAHSRQAKEYKKTDLLALSESSIDDNAKNEAGWIRQHSFNIWSKESIEDLNSFKKGLEYRIIFDALDKILEKERLDSDRQAMIESFEEFQSVFYRTMVLQLNAMYVATSSINSGMIANSGNMGLTSKIGGILKSVSPHVPLVGLGVQMIGAVMTQVDQKDQIRGIQNYATLVTNSAEMEKLATAIAIKLTQHAHDLRINKQLNFDENKIYQAMNFMSEADELGISGLAQTLKGLNLQSIVDTTINNLDLVTLTANVISGLKQRISDLKEQKTSDTKEYVKQLIFGIPETEEQKVQKEAQDKATSVASYIIKKIFDGTIKQDNNIEVIASSIHVKPVDGYFLLEIGNLIIVQAATQDNPLPQVQHERCCIVSYVNSIEYHNKNPLFHNEDLLYQTAKIGGIEAIDDLITMGEDQELAIALIESAKLYGTEHVVKVIFESASRNAHIRLESSSTEYNEVLSITAADQSDNNNPTNIEYSHTDNKIWYSDKVTLSSFTAKEAIETLPTIKYFVKEILHITYELPEFTDNNYFKLTAHFIACNVGMFSLTGKFNVANSLLPTAIYGNKLLAHEYLTNFKQSNFDKEKNKSISIYPKMWIIN
jgi:hypothetical protein